MTSEHPEVRPRAIVDPGVYVSAAITDGATRRLVQAAQAGRLTLVVSDRLLAELADVLHREKFRRWLTMEDADDFIVGITLLADHVADPPDGRSEAGLQRSQG